MDENGERHEKVYDVAVSDGREIDADGRCRTPVGTTVDEANATYLNNIGDAELRAVWTDPDFNPDHRSVYYAPVLEILPTGLSPLAFRIGRLLRRCLMPPKGFSHLLVVSATSGGRAPQAVGPDHEGGS